MKKYNGTLKRIASLILLVLLIISLVFASIVRAAVDVTIEASALQYTDANAFRGGTFWTTTLIGYVVYINSSADLKYNKTTDGGASWGGATNIFTGTVDVYDCYADWQVDGDAGAKIHIAYMDSSAAQVRYVYLDTSSDTVGGGDLIVAIVGITLAAARQQESISITKTRGGNFAIAYAWFNGSASNSAFYTSPDADTWTSKTDPRASEQPADYVQLHPANLADSNDLWALYVDASANAISLKTYDNSENSWSEAAIATMTETTVVWGFDGQIRLSDGNLILAFWNAYDASTADLQVYDIANAASITALTNIITNEAESIGASVFINQVNNDIYVTYFSGTAAGSLVAAFYQKSTDGGTNWGGEVAMQVDAEDDERWISAGCMKASLGGKFQPVWFNDDLNDIFTNSGNGVSIAASAGAPTFIPKVVIY